MLRELLKYEQALFAKGAKYIVGVDEVGRGPLAGPFVVGAVILNLPKIFDMLNKLGNSDRNNDVALEFLAGYNTITDSKKISEKRRPLVAEFIKQEALSYFIYEMSAEHLDTIGVSAATKLGFSEATKGLNHEYHHIITDLFPVQGVDRRLQTNVPHADALSVSVAAASVIAKVYRDELMRNIHSTYPQYGFDKHKGYGTKEHLKALSRFGVCPIHRRCFEPIKSILAGRVG